MWHVTRVAAAKLADRQNFLPNKTNESPLKCCPQMMCGNPADWTPKQSLGTYFCILKRLRHDKLFASPEVQSKTDMVIDSTFTAHYSLFTAFIESFECTGVSALADIEEAHSMLARGSWPASKSLRMGIGMGVGMGMWQAFDMSRVRFFSYVCRLRLLFFLLLFLSCLVLLDTLGAQINNNWRNARIAYG